MMSGGLRANARIAGLMVLGGGMGLLAVPALAQMNLPPSVGQFQGITGAPSIGGQAPAGMANRAGPPPPAGLPGAQSNPGTAAPSEKPPAMMDPTDALFDAINRGDIAAARDAVTRGADLGGHNLLGMTPIQLSVDLARNDITFLLLSNGGGQSAAARMRGRSKTGAQLLSASAVSGKPIRHADRKTARPVQTVRATTPAPQQMPRLFAGNGGTPISERGVPRVSIRDTDLGRPTQLHRTGEAHRCGRWDSRIR